MTTKSVRPFVAIPSPEPGASGAGGFLRTGEPVVIRPAASDDIADLEVMHEHMSADSLRHRFFGTGRGLAHRYVDHLAHSPDTIALVAVGAGGRRILGLGTAEPLGDGRAEVAFVVDEGSHGLGIGTLLLEAIAHEAGRRGIAELVADVMAENHEMLEVFRNAGFATASHREGDTICVAIRPGGPDEAGTSGPAHPAGARVESSSEPSPEGRRGTDPHSEVVE